MESQVMAGKSKPKLPIDIILLIVESFAPRGNHPILPPSHPTAQSLVSFTRVCRATNPTASRLLWQCCLYIDSSQRAHDFLRFLSSPPFATRWQTYGPARLFLGPFPDTEPGDDSEHSSTDSATLEDENSSTASSAWWSPLNDFPTAQAVHDILVALAPMLEVLIIDLPLRSLYPESDQLGIRPLLRHGFEALAKLEEFVSVRDELYLSTEETSREPRVWATCWPKLRRLAIYNPDVDPEYGIWRDMALILTLDVAVFTRADPGRDLSNINIKQEWLDARTAATPQDTATGDQFKREVTVAFVDCPPGLPDFTNHASDWQGRDPGNRIRVLAKGVHPPPEEAYGEDLSEWSTSPIEICQSWIKQQALDGTLWDEVCSDDQLERIAL